MPKKIDRRTKAHALRLRLKQRLSLKAIQAQLHKPVAKSTLSLWLREHPLTPEERRRRHREGGQLGNQRRWYRKAKRPR